MRPDLSLRHYGPSPGSHAHEHFQVLVGLGGLLELEIEGRGARVGAGDALLVRPGERHDFEAAQGSRCLVLDSADELWARCAVQPQHRAQVQALASYLSDALAREQAMARLYGPALLLEAWAPAAAASPRPRRAVDWEGLGAWVQARLAHPPTVGELAAQAFLSPSQFAVRCHEANGMSPLAWLRTQRLVRARQLREAGLPVADVARRTGYRSPSALVAALRRAP